jgi:release factor glutamine methyltransferase
MRIEPVTVRESLTQASRALAAVSETASLDAQVLLAHVTGCTRAGLLARPEADLDEESQRKLDSALHLLQSGLPLPYVLGEWEFYGLSFRVTPDVLIPRPETELLVETAIDWLCAAPDRRRSADVGTGSGCIAVSLAAHVPDLQVAASDVSPAALAVARENAARHTVNDRIVFTEGDLLTPVPGALDLICANLPYIPTETLHSLSVYGKEPDLALDGGPDGLALIRRLITQAREKLLPGGLMLMEIEERQGKVVHDLAREAFPDARVGVIKDLAGRDRVVKVTNLT